MGREREGFLLCVLSALSYSSAAVFAKYAFADGVTLTTMLTVRYVIAGFMFWLALAALRTTLPPRALVTRGLILGFVGFSGQSALYFSAIQRLDVSFATMILYIYPALVTTGAILLGRERFSPRRALALAVASLGIVLVLSGGGIGSVNGWGVIFAISAAVTYTIYLLVGQSLMSRIQPLVLSALVCTGAAVAFVGAGVVTSSLSWNFGSQGWAAVIAIALVSTIVAVSASFAGIARVGPTVNSIVMTLEIPVAVFYGILLFGEHVGFIQALGGGLVLSAVVILQSRGGFRLPPWSRVKPARADSQVS